MTDKKDVVVRGLNVSELLRNYAEKVKRRAVLRLLDDMKFEEGPREIKLDDD